MGLAPVNGIQITTEPEPDPILPPDPNDPAHLYDAADDGNSDSLWLDRFGGQDWMPRRALTGDVITLFLSDSVG
jgi:hypothetical protein